MIYILLAIIGSLLTLFLHESSHALIAKMAGWEIVEFKPYPHTHGNYFYFGRVSWKGTPDQEWMKRSCVAPVVKATILAIFWALLGWFLYTPLLVLAAWEVIDWLWWWKGFFLGPARTDGRRWRGFK